MESLSQLNSDSDDEDNEALSKKMKAIVLIQFNIQISFYLFSIQSISQGISISPFSILRVYGGQLFIFSDK